MYNDKHSIRIASLEDEKKWDDYVDSISWGSPYHFFAWKKAIEEAYGFNCFYLIAENKNCVEGAFPIVRIKYPFFKEDFVSLPYCDVGSILTKTRRTGEALFDYACEYAKILGIRRLEVRQPFNQFVPLNNDVFGETEMESVNKVRMQLALPESSEKLLAGFKSKLRSQIKKPVKDGLKAILGHTELIDDFYSVISRNMRDLGSPVHSKKWYFAILKYYGKRAKCGVVYMPDGTPAAAGIILCHSRIVSIPWASSLREFNRWNPNMLLYWSFLEYASGNGFEAFDFGRSTPGEGTFYFKKQWGAEPYPLFWRQWRLADNRILAVEDKVEKHFNSRKRMLAQNIISRMPLKPSVFLGSRIRKFIPL